MSMQSVSILILLFIIHTVDATESTGISPLIIDSEIDDEHVVIPCLIDRTRWAFPSILQWYRFHDNHTKPIASQFDNYPVHIDEAYRDKYSLLANGSLNIVHVQLQDNDTFECRLILIDRGLLDIKEKYFVIHRVNEKPRFVNQSNPLQIVPHYSTVTFVCQIYGVPVPTVAWYRIIDRDNLELLLNNSQILTLHNADDRMACKYRCIGQNRLDAIQNDFQLLIRGSIYWRRFPESQSVRINQSLTLQCEGESSEPLQYQWFKDDVPISDRAPSQDRIRTYSDGVLAIQQIEPADHGFYVCVISAPNSISVRSRPATIAVKYPPTPSRSRLTKNLTLIRGSPGLCPCLLDAYPPIQSVSWYRNGIAVRIVPKGGYSINHDYALVIRSVDSDDNGEYYCRAQNSEGFGQASHSFNVVSKEPIKFVLKPQISYSVNEGNALIVPCVAFGNPQPTIRWFRNSMMLSESRQNLTFHRIEKADHGTYVCHASNEHTTTNITTLINVENTTPQAPHHIQYRQSGTRLFLSWEAGYDGGRTQYFMLWYRNLSTKKRLWNQIRVLPTNSTEFILFDLKLQQNYELTIVGENELGLGSFSPILTIQLNETEDMSIGFLRQSNGTNIVRPSSPTSLRLSYSGSNLYITWNHANQIDSAAKIVHYVLQWRSTILFNNEQSHQSIVIDYPIRSFLVKNIKQSNYIVQLLAYSDRGIYSPPIEGQIHIRFNSIFAYSGSNVSLIVLFCFLILLTMASICLCLFCLFKYYHHRRTYSTDLECDSKWICGCFPRLQYRLNDCSHLKVDRYRANLLKSNDLPTTPLYIPSHRLIASTPTVQLRTSSPEESTTDSTISLARVTSIPRCRDSIVSHANLHVVLEDGKATDSMSPVPYIDLELRKNAARLPLEVVPEMSELDVANSRYSFDPTSTVPHPQRPHSAVQASPMLITFDSSSLKRRQ